MIGLNNESGVSQGSGSKANASSNRLLIAWVLLIAVASGCSPKDNLGPAITNIQTSSKVLAKSDCIPTSVTISADIADNSGIAGADLWFRVGQDQKFTSTPMQHERGNSYSATVIGLGIPGGEYGVVEFYIFAEDGAGNQSKSPIDRSIELLMCVAN